MSHRFGDLASRESFCESFSVEGKLPPAIDATVFSGHDYVCEHPAYAGCEGAHSTGRTGFDGHGMTRAALDVKNLWIGLTSLEHPVEPYRQFACRCHLGHTLWLVESVDGNPWTDGESVDGESGDGKV